ncbi:MAG: hypothetical protein CL840_19910 [Crocinitomicaceae bacterium]|nr:hypothetical protein [Crocinitomicaceae bacterium]|tara:strand:+ start:1378 stop:2133 length:756 start_codon:yes stop_codon:yes gene_type:complete
MSRLFILLLIVLISLSLQAQKKKKKVDYDEYWKQQEQLELFDKKSNEAHGYFQEGKLKLALSSYEEALKLNPDDQKTIAKIRDIKILLIKKEQAAKEPPPVKVTEDTKAEGPTNTDTTNNKPPIPPSKPTLDAPAAEKIVVKDTLPKEAPTVKAKPKKVETKIPEPTPADKPYKNTENYRKYLATLFPEGWTEEEYTEGNKQMVKRVHIANGIGDEYLKVTHHYGAIFYFKNGLSITYGTWVSETKGLKKK